MRPLKDETGGITLTELIAVMVLTLIVGAASLKAIEGTQASSTKTTARQEAVQEAEHSMARMTREIHQAAAVAFRDQETVDLKTRVRNASTDTSELRWIRYRCFAERCTRYDYGAAPAGALLSQTPGTPVRQADAMRGIDGDESEFSAQLDGVAVPVTSPIETPASNGSVPFDFVSFRMTVRLDDFDSGRQAYKKLDPVELTGGVDIANLQG